jgi:integrase/recombinase XerD
VSNDLVTISDNALTGELLAHDRSLAKIINDGNCKTPAELYISKHSTSEAQRVASVKVEQVALLLGFTNANQIRWDVLNYTHANLLKSRLLNCKNQFGETLAPATINHTLTAFRQMAKCAWLMKQINNEQMAALQAVEHVRGSRVKERSLPIPVDIEKLLDVCFQDNGVAGARDAAIIIIAFGAGLRRSEIVQLQYPRHLNEKQSYLLVRGKGNKERKLPLEPYMLDVIQTWIYDVRGDHPGALFTRIRKGDDIQDGQLTPAAVRYILEQRCLEAGVSIIRPHDARHAYATDLLKNKADIVTVKNLLGHSSIATTEKYIHKHEDDMRNAVRDNLSLFSKLKQKP